MQTVSVPLNKTKLIQHAAGCGVFVLVSLWICSLSPSEMPGPVKHIPWLGYGVSFLGIVLFGAVGFSLVQKLLGSAPGIVFDERGITDDSGVLAAGFIPWENINGFEVAEVSNQKQLFVLLNDREQCLTKVNPLKRFCMNLVAKSGPSPVAVSPAYLTVELNQLAVLANESLAKMKKG